MSPSIPSTVTNERRRSVRLLGLLLATVLGGAACGPSAPAESPKACKAESAAPAAKCTDQDARSKKTATGPEGTVDNCDRAVCKAGTFCDTQTSSKHRCHSELPYVGRPFDRVAALTRTRVWGDA